MSLKAFHFVFIGASTILSAGLGVWGLVAFANGAGWSSLLGAAVALASGAGLVWYGNRALKKLRGLSYL